MAQLYHEEHVRGVMRQFETLAAGVMAIPIAPKKYDIDSVLIARGQGNSGTVLAAAKLAATSAAGNGSAPACA